MATQTNPQNGKATKVLTEADLLKDTLMVNMPAVMKQAIADWCRTHGNISMNDLARQAIAAKIGFDLASVEAAKGPALRKYSSLEEKEAARKARQKKDRELKAALLKQWKDEQKAKAIEALQKSLTK